LTLEAIDIAREIVNTLEDKKAENILLLDLRPDTLIADFFVICTGNSDRQLKALTEHVRENLKVLYDRAPFAVEGSSGSGWVLMDYGDVVVHIFTAEQRRYYDIEGMYAGANVLVSIQ
jgi:ribosome-associated protein